MARASDEGHGVVRDRLQVGVYDLYWSTLGGGEQVDGTIASVLASDHDVTLLGPEPIDVDRIRERLGVDLSGCHLRCVIDDADASDASADFDLFVNGTYRSTAINRAPEGWYYVHFPQPPPGWRDIVRQHVARAGARALAREGLPARLGEVRTGFDRRVRRTEHLSTYQRYLANSRFTAGWVEQLWGVPTTVVYPPVRAELSAGDKQPLVLNVGRFFDPRLGHSKKQLEMIGAFDRLGLEGWELALVGGCDAANREYALAARRAALGRPIRVHINARGEVVKELFAAASIYWSATGYGADPRRHPEQFEHFGINIVEAMAAGAVPIVYGAAGPAEIVEHGVNGFHWHDIEELVALTRRLAARPEERDRLALAARTRAEDFSVKRFAAEVKGLLTERPTRAGAGRRARRPRA